MVPKISREEETTSAACDGPGVDGKMTRMKARSCYDLEKVLNPNLERPSRNQARHFWALLYSLQGIRTGNGTKRRESQVLSVLYMRSERRFIMDLRNS